ncbi:MAG: hypothetical protein ACXWQ5_22010 [Ktedonobacterales bacterium]
MNNPHAARWQRLQNSIVRGPGQLDAATRAALASGHDIPEPLASYAEKVARYAYKVTDDDIAALLAAGYSEDQLFEATLSVALGAAQMRLRAGLDALHAAQASHGEEE